MSIFVRQPAPRARALSGLGAYAQLLPSIQQRGVAALADADACDFDLLLFNVRTELGLRSEYRRNPQALDNDAAAHARAIYARDCPNANMANAEAYYGMAGDDDPHRRHGRARKWSPSAQRAAQREAQSRMHAATRMMTPVTTPSHLERVYNAPMAAGYRTTLAPDTYSSKATPMSFSRTRAPDARYESKGTPMTFKGLGSVVGAGLSPSIAVGPSPAFRLTSDQLSRALDDTQRASVRASLAMTDGTLDPCLDPVSGADIPCASMTATQASLCARCSGSTSSVMPSFSIEGALPGGVALLLGAALGLVSASMFVGK